MFGPCKSDEQSRKRGSDTSIRWAAIPSIPTPERCSRELEGRKQQKDVVIRHSRLMIDTTIRNYIGSTSSRVPVWYRTRLIDVLFFLKINDLKDFNDLEDFSYKQQ